MLNQLRDRTGVALPLALMGLVVVSFLVMTAIVTSGAELTVSSTHQQATAAFYEADAALERFVSTTAAGSATQTDSLYPVNGAAAGGGFGANVGRLFSSVETINEGKTLFQRQLYSVVTYPLNGRGRSVGAFVRTERQADLFTITVDAGLTVGGNVTVTGSSTVSDGRDATACDPAQAAENALQVTEGSHINKTGASQILGKADTTDYHKTEMVDRLLGGMTINEAIRYANVKFGPGEFVSNQRIRSHDNGVPRLRTHRYNWGCPTRAGIGCTQYEANTTNMEYFPMIAIDAGGGTIRLEGDHGQGVLIIHNGSLEIRGNMNFHGIIVVEKDLTVRGTSSGGGVKIEGAVVALGHESIVEDTTSGNATIVFNACVTTEAQDGANEHRLASAPQTFPSGTSNWFEVLR